MRNRISVDRCSTIFSVKLSQARASEREIVVVEEFSPALRARKAWDSVQA
jgi:hypothetical protein